MLILLLANTASLKCPFFLDFHIDCWIPFSEFRSYSWHLHHELGQSSLYSVIIHWHYIHYVHIYVKYIYIYILVFIYVYTLYTYNPHYTLSHHWIPFLGGTYQRWILTFIWEITKLICFPSLNSLEGLIRSWHITCQFLLTVFISSV